MDIVAKSKRSRMMAGIKGKDTRPEMDIRKALFRRGYRYRMHVNYIPGNPDLVLRKYRAVIFINGCFWHQHNCHLFKWPKSRSEFWRNKISGNKARDIRIRDELRKSGWRVLTVWECAIKGKGRLPLGTVVDQIECWLKSDRSEGVVQGMSEPKQILIEKDGDWDSEGAEEVAQHMHKDKHDTFGTVRARELGYRSLHQMMTKAGVRKIYVKSLAPNDNSKNQIYLGGNFSAVNIIPVGSWESYSAASAKRTLKPGSKLVRGSVDFYWVDPEGGYRPAPDTKIILYPQYPEVRFSGFLSNSTVNASKWMDIKKSGRSPGRYLLIGIHPDGKCFGYLAVPESRIASELAEAGFGGAQEVLQEAGHPDSLDRSSKSILIDELKRIYRASPVAGKKYNKCIRRSEPYRARNGAGFTLEAELGISPNGYAEPDFMGWEIKAHGSNVVTLLTPEPSGGLYQTKGIDYFMHHYGYAAVDGTTDRLNFGGVHRFGMIAERTGLELKVFGYEGESNELDLGGSFALVDPHDRIAAEWSFEKMLSHWNRKHAQTAFVDYRREKRGDEYWYWYLSPIYLGEGTDFLKFVSAVHNRQIYYDPGIKMEDASSGRPRVKKRSQFRVSFRNLPVLYDSWEAVNVADGN